MKEKGLIETKDLCVGYGGQVLIRDICLSIQKGEIVTLIGPNGGGKSTILKSLTRHLRTTGGRVVIGGEDLERLSFRALAEKMAVVFTQGPEPELMTCWEVAASGRYPHTGRLGVLSQRDRDMVARALETVHAGALAQRDFRAVSDGQRQRVLLARAICQEPEIIVLDEPTSFLDIRYKLELLSLLRSMAKERGITVILSLHELELAEKISDKLVCVKGEEIFRFGAAGEIFCPQVIQELYGLEEGAFNIAFGSVELPRTGGEPRVFVLSGGGAGIPVFRELQRRGLPFAAGVLHENDVDYQVARALAARVVAERPFYPIGEEAFAQARELMYACGRVVRAPFPLGPGNARQEELARLALEAGLLWEL